LDVRPRIEALEQVVALAPAFAPAWAALAQARAYRLRYGGPNPSYAAMRAEVVEAAETALGLDVGSGGAYLALALLEPWANYAGQEALLLQAMSASPSAPVCLITMAQFLNGVGRRREAGVHARRASELDPFSVSVAFWRAAIASHAGGPDDSEQLFDAFRTRWPHEAVLGASELIGLAGARNWARFDRVVASMQERGMGAPAALRMVSRFGALRNPSPDTRKHIFERLRRELDRTGSVQLLDLFDAYSSGLAEETFDVIERASFAHMFDEQGAPPSRTINQGGIFSIYAADSMPNDIRFVGLCAKMGLCDYWVQTGHWPDCADQVPYDFRAEARKQATTQQRPG
jgi:hypothetical protein